MASALPCEVAAICGGCPLMAAPRGAELLLKAEAVESALHAADVTFPASHWQYAGEPLGYRNRLRLRVQADGRVAFFNQHKASGCVVLEPALAELVARVRVFADTYPAHVQPFAHLEVRAPDVRAQSGVCFHPRPADSPALGPVESEFTLLGPEVLSAVAHVMKPEAMPYQRFLIAEDVLCLVPLDAFMQVNSSANRAFVACLRALCRRHDVQSFVDIFAGAGNLSLPLLRDGLRGKIVERSASAVHAFRIACAEQGFADVESVAGDAEGVSVRWLESGIRVDLVVIDAPRAGVKRGLAAMAALARRHVAVCSCNPQTLARDLRALAAQGFVVRELFLFDMFPQTRHVEVLAWLERSHRKNPSD